MHIETLPKGFDYSLRAAVSPAALSVGSLAEFAPAGAKEVGLIFRGDMRLAKNTSRGADCASKASAGSEAQFFLKSKLRLRFEYFYSIGPFISSGSSSSQVSVMNPFSIS